MAGPVTLEQVEALAAMLPKRDQRKLVTRVSERLDRKRSTPEYKLTPEAFDELLAATREAAHRAGIFTLEDVDRLVAEVRAERKGR